MDTKAVVHSWYQDSEEELHRIKNYSLSLSLLHFIKQKARSLLMNVSKFCLSMLR